MTLAPIVLFVYNRPAHTHRTVEALLKNEEAKESDLIIYSDAPKENAAAETVREVREYISSITGFRSVSIVERDRNYGLANSIIDGVTTVVNQYGRIIVLEDDLVVTPHFLDFMNSALDKYENEQRVIQISGYMFPVKVKIKEDALFLPLTTSWGWSTWRRAWQRFDPDAKGYAQVKADMALRDRFNLNGAYDYFSMLEAQLEGRVDSWAIRWYLATFLFEGLTLFPRQSLVNNVGLDGTGTHGDRTNRMSNIIQTSFVCEHFPEVVSISDRWVIVRLGIRRDRSLVGQFVMWIRQTFAVLSKGDKCC